MLGFNINDSHISNFFKCQLRREVSLRGIQCLDEVHIDVFIQYDGSKLVVFIECYATEIFSHIMTSKI